MKGKNEVGIVIAICSIIISVFAIDVIGNTFFGFYEIINPYYLFMFFLFLGLVVFTIGLIGRLSKVKHPDGYNSLIVIGLITLLSVYLFYWIGWWWM